MGSEAAGLEHVVVGRAPAPQPGRRHPRGEAEQLVVDPTYVGRDPLDRRAGWSPHPSAALAASRLRPGGVWRLATDWADYAEQMVRVLDAEPGLRGWRGRSLGRAAGDEVRSARGLPPAAASPTGRSADRVGQPPPAMLTSHEVPNRSTHIPNSSPHGWVASSTVTVPPSDSACQ